MNKKYFSFILSLLFAISICTPVYSTTYRYVNAPAPKATPEVKASIVKYKQGNYTGAMIDLEELLKKDRKNTLARYYLALCYTQLGYKESAKKAFNDVVKKDANEVLTYYSQRALDCLENPDADTCSATTVNKNPQNPENNGEEQSEENKPTDMDIFIQSGKMIHPAAMDAITRERMERKLQEEEYLRQQEQSEGIKMDQSYNQMPTNEEIVAALNILSKVGMNPFNQNLYNNMNYLSNNQTALYSQLSNQDVMRMLMSGNAIQTYGMQLNGLGNDILDYGI